jgi:hypothetical protein
MAMLLLRQIIEPMPRSNESVELALRDALKQFDPGI